MKKIIMKSSISRGRETAGYLVWTAREAGTNKKLAAANGGGYDIYSTALCLAFCSANEDLLIKSFSGIDLNNNPEFYGISRLAANGKIYADGRCGEEVIRSLANQCGLKVIETKIDKNTYLVEFV